MGFRAGRLLLAVLLAAGCAAPRPEGPEPAPAPASAAEAAPAAPPAPIPEPKPGPVPVLSLVPGTEHLFRVDFDVTMTPGEESPMGQVKMKYAADVRYRIGPPADDGRPVLLSTVDRIAGTMDMVKLGVHMTFDSADEAQRRASRKENPMAGFFQMMFRDVGETRSWGAFPMDLPTATTGGRRKDGPDSPLSSLALPWVDVLPGRPLRKGDSLKEEEVLRILGAKPGDGAASLVVRDWDPVSGVADLVLRMEGKNLADPSARSGTGPDLASATMVIEDRFDVRGGRYLVREFRMKGDGSGVGAVFGTEPGGAFRVEIVIRSERVEGFAATAAPGPK